MARAATAKADGRGAQPREWYADGLRFECTMCGNCCTGPPGVVRFTPEEGRAMAAELGMAEGDFYSEHARKLDNRWTLRETRSAYGLDCVFLDRQTMPGKAICGVYRSRPGQCRTWPFWPENLESQAAWQATKKRTPCPGMDRGPVIGLTQIRIRRDATPA